MKKDIIGQRFGKLVVLQKLPRGESKYLYYLCKCDCGNETKSTKYHLTSGGKKSCGCLRRKSPANVIDMTGKKFGKLTVIKRSGRTKNDNATWLCECDCGNTTVAMGTSLRRGDTVSCGCSINEQIKSLRKAVDEDTVDGVQVSTLRSKVREDSGSGYKGIYKRDRNGKITYEPSISIKGKRIHLGVYDNLEDAIKARKQGELYHHLPLYSDGSYNVHFTIRDIPKMTGKELTTAIATCGDYRQEFLLLDYFRRNPSSEKYFNENYYKYTKRMKENENSKSKY